MQAMAERVGPAFSAEGMLAARVETRKAIAAIAARVSPGMREEEAVTMAKETIAAQGHALSWHPTRVRFGINTIQSMRKPWAPGVVLGENDIFFIDIAPRVENWEGDGGASFVVGHAPELARCAADAEHLFHAMKCGRSGRNGAGAGSSYMTLRPTRRPRWAGSLISNCRGTVCQIFPMLLFIREHLPIFRKRLRPCVGYSRYICSIPNVDSAPFSRTCSLRMCITNSAKDHGCRGHHL